MSSVQERLQMKRVPVDTWSTKEQLCLASSVVRSGDQNWMSVSRTLKSLGDPNRPSDWFSQKSCAAQYGSLLEHVETPKRKKRTTDGAAECPQESILKRLTVDRLAELHKSMAELRQQYDKIKEEINEIRSPNISDIRVRDMCASMDSERRTRDREIARHSQWLREREDRKMRAERGWRPSGSGAPLLTSLLKSAASPTTGTATSVTVAANFDSAQHAMTSQAQTQIIQHIMPHPSTLPDIVSPSAGAPTLSMLLEKPASGSVLPHLPPQATDNNKNAEIEHIKNQLQAIEQKLNGGMVPVSQSPLVTPPIPRPLPVIAIPLESPGKTAAEDKIEIDDIEIKAEDVYAFSDIDIEIPPVSSIHKSSLGTRGMDKNLFNKKESNLGLGSLEDLPGPSDFPNVPSNSELESRKTATPVPEISFSHEIKKEIVFAQPKQEPVDELLDSSISVQEVPVESSFPEPEIVQEQINLVEQEPPTIQEPVNIEIKEEPAAITEIETLDDQMELETTLEDDSELINEEPSTSTVIEETVEDLPQPVPESLSKDTEPNVEQQTEEASEDLNKSQIEVVTEETEKDIENAVEEPVIPEPKITKETEPVEEKEGQVHDEDEKLLREAEEPIPEQLPGDIPLPKEPAPTSEPFRIPTPEVVPAKPDEQELPEEAEKEKVEPEKEELTESQAETDDDTPMEVAREEEKLGRTKRDYSRRRADAHRSEFSDDAQSDTSLSGPAQDKKPAKIAGTPSRPWSPATPSASPAGSPAPTRDSTHDDDKDYRLWKKSVMLVYSRLCTHKYASLFLRPISDDQAPGYSLVVKRPMDLSTIRKNIDAGVIKTTVEFQHDVLLMLSNALMYNNSTHRVHLMAQEMHREAAAQLGMLLQAQAHAELSTAPRAPPVTSASASAKRKRTSHPATPPPPKKKRDE